MDELKQCHLEILDGSNYAIWKWQIEGLLKVKKLYEVVESNIKPDADKDCQAKVLIASSLNRSNKMKVINCSTAYETWKRLESIYENKTSFEKQNLLGKLHSYRIKSHNQLSESISEIQNIAAKLSLLGETISDSMVISIILKALPASFKQFAMSWRLLAEKERTLNSLISNIMALAEDDHDSDDKAFLARNKQFRRNKGRYRSTPDNKKKQSWTTRDSPNKDITCHYCNKQGHVQKDCFKRQRESQQQRQPNNNVSRPFNRAKNNGNNGNRWKNQQISLMAV